MPNENYLPVPPRVWSRVQNPCTFTVPGSTYTQAYIPVTNQVNKLFPNVGTMSSIMKRREQLQ